MRTDAHGPPRPSPHALGPTCCTGDAVRVRIAASAEAGARAPSGRSTTIALAVRRSGTPALRHFLPAPLSPCSGGTLQKRSSPVFFHEGKGSRLRSGATNPGEDLRPSVAVHSNARNATKAAVEPNPSMGGSCAIRPWLERCACRTDGDASAETRLVHATCTPKARRESRRRKAAFSTECRGGSAAHLQYLIQRP